MGKMIGMAEFKAKCIALLDEIERSGQPLTITRRGKPALTVTARAAEQPVERKLFGAMKGTFVLHGDVDEPLDPGWEKRWEAKWEERGFPACRDGTDDPA